MCGVCREQVRGRGFLENLQDVTDTLLSSGVLSLRWCARSAHSGPTSCSIAMPTWDFCFSGFANRLECPTRCYSPMADLCTQRSSAPITFIKSRRFITRKRCVPAKRPVNIFWSRLVSNRCHRLTQIPSASYLLFFDGYVFL